MNRKEELLKIAAAIDAALDVMDAFDAVFKYDYCDEREDCDDCSKINSEICRTTDAVYDDLRYNKGKIKLLAAAAQIAEDATDV